MNNESSAWKLGFILAFFTSVLWGVLPYFLKVALKEMDALTVTWFRFLLAFALLAVYLSSRGKFPRFHNLARSGLALLAVATVFLVGNYVLYLIGLELTSPANAQVLIQLGPFFFALGGLFLYREKYSPMQWAGVVILFAGFSLFFRDQFLLIIEERINYLWGSLWIVISALSWAIYALAQKRLLRFLPPAGIMVGIYGGSVLLMAPMVAPLAVVKMSGWALGALFFCGLNTLIAYGMFAQSLSYWDVSRVSAVLALNPLVTLGFGALVSWAFPSVTPHAITSWGVLGASLVVTGSMLTALAGKKRKALP